MKKVIRLTESDLKRIVRRVLNEDVDPTTPTGVVNSSGNLITLDKNSSLGILNADQYRLFNMGPVFKNYNTTKKIPDDTEYWLQLKKSIVGNIFSVFHHGYLTIKDGILVGNTWKDLISKSNNASLNPPNDLSSDANNIIQSLLIGEVPCFEIDTKKTQYIAFDVKTGIVDDVALHLKSTCDEKITSCELILNSSDGVTAKINDEDVAVIWDGKNLKFGQSNTPNDEVTPNNNVTPKPTINDNNTTPTGVADSSGYFLTLDKNDSFGILDGTNYFLSIYDPVFKNYNTTKKIPNGVDYYLNVKKTLDGITVSIDHNGYLTIKDGKLIDNVWKNLFSKFNNVSFNTQNDLSSDANKIIKSLLKNKVRCFEIDREAESNNIEFDPKTGTVNQVILKLKSKCDEKIPYVFLELNSSDGITATINQKDVTVIWDGKDLKFGQSNVPNDEVTPNNNTTPKPTLNDNNTTPTGFVDSDSNFVLDENVFLGVLGDGEYVFYGEPLKNDGTRKKIPDGSGYSLYLRKNLNGYNFMIDSNERLTIRDGKLNGMTWGSLFSKINYVSMTNPNDLLSNEDDIFQSLLDNTVPCFEIDKEKEHKVFYDVKTGIANTFVLYLKSKCNKKITSVRLTLDKFNNVTALVNGKMANTIWDGNDLKFRRSKKQKLITKVNENVRKALITYF